MRIQVLDFAVVTRSKTAMTEFCVQQFCEHPSPAVIPAGIMSVIGQSGAMLLVAMGQPGTQAGTNPAAQLRLERTGCAASRPITTITAVLSRYFIRPYLN